MICPNCKRETPPEFFCYACDVYMTNPALGVKAGVARRWAALFLDSVALWLVFFIVLAFSTGVGVAAGGREPALGVFVGTFFTTVIAYSIFQLWFLAQGKTPGKWILNMRCVNKKDGGVPGLGRMLVRETFGKFASGFFLGIGYFSAVWDRQNQTWHDKIAGTLVLREMKSHASAVGPAHSPKAMSTLNLGAVTATVPSTPPGNVASASPTGILNLTPSFANVPQPKPATTAKVCVEAAPRAIFCDECGAKLEEGGKFCDECGAQLV